MKYQASEIEQALSMAESGMSAMAICELIGVSDTAFYGWKEKYAGLNAAGIDLYRSLDKENRDLLRTVGRLQQDITILQEVIEDHLNGDLKQKQVDCLMAKHPISRKRAQTLLLLK